VHQTGLTAIQCARALLASANRGNTAVQHGLSQLIPELVQFLADVAEKADAIELDTPLFVTADEVIKVLSTFVASFDDSGSEYLNLEVEGIVR
jgi:hypothetical protein